MKQPQVGDTVRVNDPAFDRLWEGKVTQLLAMQFTFDPLIGGIYLFCLYSSDWTVIKKRRPRLSKSRLGRKKLTRAHLSH